MVFWILKVFGIQKSELGSELEMEIRIEIEIWDYLHSFLLRFK